MRRLVIVALAFTLSRSAAASRPFIDWYGLREVAQRGGCAQMQQRFQEIDRSINPVLAFHGLGALCRCGQTSHFPSSASLPRLSHKLMRIRRRDQFVNPPMLVALTLLVRVRTNDLSERMLGATSALSP